LREELYRIAKLYAEAAGEELGENLVSVALFGSVARGDVRPGSDIDLFIVCRHLPKGAFRRQEFLEPVRRRVDPEIERLWKQGIPTDVTEIARTVEEARRFHSIYLDMTEEAIILFDRDGFLSGILERVRQRLKELGARRLKIGKVYYWDLKPDLRPGEAVEIEI